MGRNDKIKYCVRSRISLKTSASLKYCIDPKTKRGFSPPKYQLKTKVILYSDLSISGHFFQ